MALELIVKASVMLDDATYKPKDGGHKTSDLIKKYADEVGVLKLIRDDTEKMSLIKELEVGWEGLRYGECGIQSDGKDSRGFNDIMELLIGEYQKRSGLRTL